jgi:alpha-galactosidase
MPRTVRKKLISLIGAAVKSPLLIGTSMTALANRELSVLIHAPIIALNQDPLGTPASRRWTRGSTQLWAGPLVSTSGGRYQDYVVILVNTGGGSTGVSATLSEIFGGTPPANSYEIRDLWATRLTDSQASTILNSGWTANPSWIYNSTSKPYATGLSEGNTLLLGTSIGTVAGGGTISANVNANGSKVYRLRATTNGTVTAA